jgi:hypothetical protein
VRRPAKPATVRFYFDADFLGLAKVVVRRRNEVTYPGDPGGIVHKRERPPCPVTDPATPDDVWIPIVASWGWLILTRDSRIQDHRAEIDGVRHNDARMIALAGKEAKGTWDQLEVFMCQWRSIKATLKQDGPFVYSATRTTLRSIPLD